MITKSQIGHWDQYYNVIVRRPRDGVSRHTHNKIPPDRYKYLRVKHVSAQTNNFQKLVRLCGPQQYMKIYKIDRLYKNTIYI